MARIGIAAKLNIATVISYEVSINDEVSYTFKEDGWFFDFKVYPTTRQTKIYD